MTDDKNALHAEICRLWQRYQDLGRAVVTLEADVADLEARRKAAGKAIYELYLNSDAGLDGEPPPH